MGQAAQNIRLGGSGQFDAEHDKGPTLLSFVAGGYPKLDLGAIARIAQIAQFLALDEKVIYRRGKAKA